MKLFLLTRKNLVMIIMCFLITVVSVGIVVSNGRQAIATISQEREIPVYCVDTKEKEVSISFDAAWGNEQTKTLLKILDEYKVKTSFFLVGDWVDKYPDSVKDIAKHGHEVENHSNTHPHMTQLDVATQCGEINSCNKKIKKLIGKYPTLFRAPYGDYDNSVVTSAKENNMYCVQWSIDSIDWENPTAAQMVERIGAKLECGSIILLHNGAKNTPEALPLIIEAIRDKGYKIVPISKLISRVDTTPSKCQTDVQGKLIN